MQSVALEPAPTTVINRLVVPVLRSIHETAVYRLARTNEQQCKGRNAIVADGWLHYVHLEPDRAPYVGFDQLSSVFGRCGGGLGHRSMSEVEVEVEGDGAEAAVLAGVAGGV